MLGAAHPNKDAAHRLLDRAVAAEHLLVTSAEVFQEILHRYSALMAIYRISAHDALHVAVMEEAGIEEIMTFDSGFDAVPTIRRMI